MWVGKGGVLEHKSGNRPMSETCKDRGKLWRAYRKSTTLFRMDRPDWGFANPTQKPKTPIAIRPISGTGDATDFKFG